MSSKDFCADDNLCGQNILKIVSRGNAIIAELLRLSNFTPAVFYLQGSDKDKYGAIITDFQYFTNSDAFEKRIDDQGDLQDLDQHFKDNHIEILQRFYSAFESVYKYISDLRRFIEELDDGIFIQYSLEKVMLDPVGKQLMVEALYLFAIMLLNIDRHFTGIVRERIIVSCYRYLDNSKGGDTIDQVAKLLRMTKYVPGQRIPPAYPEEYFTRFKLPKLYIDMVLSRLRYDDIYNQVSSFPSASHRSTALATQASMMYCILYFKPNILKNEASIMREIVDKYFSDNWVISLYMGHVVNLIENWDSYPAAKTALNNTITPVHVKHVATKHLKKLPSLNEEAKVLLDEGLLTEKYILDNNSKILHFLRDCNVTIRWCTLHTIVLPNLVTKCKKMREIILNDPKYDKKKVFMLLLHTGYLEFTLKEIMMKMIKNKEEMWTKCRDEAVLRMGDLSTYFSGEKMLQRVEKNKSLEDYFSKISEKAASLTYMDDLAMGRKIVQLIQALEEVQEFHQLDTNLPVRQVLMETRDLLHQMLRSVNIREEDVAVMQVIGDLSYAWEHMDSQYTAMTQQSIKNNPSLVDNVRATFVKLSSTMEMPLLRIMQARSPDLESVSQYYSRELVSYVRKVLQIIPESMFKLLDQIVKIQTHKMKEVPTRLEKDKLKEYAQLDERFELAKATHGISVLAEGILAMKSTLVGFVQLDPKQLLEDGIRKELVRQVATALNQFLRFEKSRVANINEVKQQLIELNSILQGFRVSFEYIQDYVNIYGLKIWQEEVSRIINFNIEQECNSFLTSKVYEWESSYQSVAIPIPKFAPVDQSVNFIGRLARELLRLTDSKTTVYIDQMSIWYDQKTTNEVMGRDILVLVEKAVGTFGLVGLDRLYSFMIVKHCQDFLKRYRKKILADHNLNALLRDFHITVGEGQGTVENAVKTYGNIIYKFTKVFQEMGEIIDIIGQIQLLRRLILFINRFSSKIDSKALESTLRALNDALLNDINAHYQQPHKPYPDQTSDLLPDLASYLTNVGVGDPFSQIYVTTSKLDYLPLIMFLFVISQLSKCTFNRDVSTLVNKNKYDSIDGTPLVIGVITILKQFHRNHTSTFLAYIGQYVRSVSQAHLKSGSSFGPEIFNSFVFLDHFCSHSGLPRSTVEAHIPSYLFDEFYTSSFFTTSSYFSRF